MSASESYAYNALRFTVQTTVNITVLYYIRTITYCITVTIIYKIVFLCKRKYIGVFVSICKQFVDNFYTLETRIGL
jgi:hypothetical protein